MEIKLKNINKLPSRPGIYAVIENNNILYVGKSENLWQRWNSNHKMKKIIKNEHVASKIDYIELNRNKIDYYEKEFIKIWKPPYNIFGLKLLYEQDKCKKPFY